MGIKEFTEIMKHYLKELNIELSSEQIKQFYEYMNLLIKWNTVMNITSITDPNEIIIKHFVDSLTVLNKVEKTCSIIDVGTGAGFPGIPIKIVYPNTQITLLDSLNKRINFLNEVINKLKLKNIVAIHGRAEDFGNDVKHREKYDIAVARAVASLNILSEYLMPFVKLGGKCLCMKGPDIKEEELKSKNAVSILGGEEIKRYEFSLPYTDIKRTIIEINKAKCTPKEYPRKAGIPSKNPL